MRVWVLCPNYWGPCLLAPDPLLCPLGPSLYLGGCAPPRHPRTAPGRARWLKATRCHHSNRLTRVHPAISSAHLSLTVIVEPHRDLVDRLDHYIDRIYHRPIEPVICRNAVQSLQQIILILATLAQQPSSGISRRRWRMNENWKR